MGAFWFGPCIRWSLRWIIQLGDTWAIEDLDIGQALGAKQNMLRGQWAGKDWIFANSGEGGGGASGKEAATWDDLCCLACASTPILHLLIIPQPHFNSAPDDTLYTLL